MGQFRVVHLDVVTKLGGVAFVDAPSEAVARVVFGERFSKKEIIRVTEVQDDPRRAYEGPVRS